MKQKIQTSLDAFKVPCTIQPGHGYGLPVQWLTERTIRHVIGPHTAASVPRKAPQTQRLGQAVHSKAEDSLTRR